MARFSDDHVEAARIREQVGRREAVGGAPVPPRPVAVAGAERADEVEYVLSSGAGLEGVPFCLAWLRQHAGHEAEQGRCAQLLDALAARLEPSPQQLPDDLQQRAAYAAQLWQIVPKQTWPGLYAVAARWWLGDAAGAQSLAASLPQAADEIQGPPQLRLVLGVCWWRAGRLAAAVGLLRQLRRDVGVRPQADAWLRVILTARQAAKRGDRKESTAKLAAGLLRD
ncbi:MAG: hypothetical protein NTY19_49795 [Planctomycetota bacterium]|nr:hypothetical protein [Planctomycetota bacterium]